MISRRGLLKVLGIGAIASLIPSFSISKPAPIEIKVTGAYGIFRKGDVIEINQPQEVTAGERWSTDIIPRKKMYLIHGVKDDETLIVSEVN